MMKRLFSALVLAVTVAGVMSAQDQQGQLIPASQKTLETFRVPTYRIATVTKGATKTQSEIHLVDGRTILGTFYHANTPTVETMSLTWQAITLGMKQEGKTFTIYKDDIALFTIEAGIPTEDEAFKVFMREHKQYWDLMRQVHEDLKDRLHPQPPTEDKPLARLRTSTTSLLPTVVSFFKSSSSSFNSSSCGSAQTPWQLCQLFPECRGCSLVSSSIGRGHAFFRSEACGIARLDASNGCNNGICWGCCRYTPCDCLCALDDWICACNIGGHPCNCERDNCPDAPPFPEDPESLRMPRWFPRSSTQSSLQPLP